LWYNQDNESEDNMNMELVDLIASGYEWICPKCNAFNTEIEVV